MMGLNFQDTLKKAEGGDIEAQHTIAEAYFWGSFDGADIADDFAQAINWYRKAAESGHADSAYTLGCIYLSRLGPKGDASEAAKWYDKALASGSYDLGGTGYDLFQIADAYYFGQKGVSINYAEALKWYRLAVEGGWYEAAYKLGNMYAAGEGVPKDDNEAARWYHKTAEMDSYAWNAWYKLGLIYRDGIGVSKDSEKAWDWLDQAARKGHADAQYALGMMQLAGEAPDIDGADWFREAAGKGHVLAQLAHGEAEEVRGSLGFAYAWYHIAVSNGNAAARSKLDLLMPRMSRGDILSGQTAHAGLLEGFAKKETWRASQALKDARREHANALEEEGDCYFYGRGVPKDYGFAYISYREAARYGSAMALYHAGLCCLKREEPYRNEMEAYAYWSLALTLHGLVRDELAKLEEKMSPDDRVRGQEIANMIREDIEANKLGE